MGSERTLEQTFAQREKLVSLKEKNSFPKLVPDFVVELLSETDKLDEIKGKMDKWIKNGVRYSWLVNPKEQLTYVYQEGSEIVTETSFDESLSGENVLTGFEVKLSEILEY